MTEDEMVGWHDQLHEHEFEKTPGDSEGQGSLACCSSWGYKELDKRDRATTYMRKEEIPKINNLFTLSVQFSSVAQSCLTLCDPMNCSTPSFPVYHQLPELTQTHVHRVGDAIQLPHPLSSPSPPAFNLSQHRGLFK